MREPIRPGETLRGIIEWLGKSAAELARQIEVPVSRIAEIRTGQRFITGDTALRLGRYSGNSRKFWLNLQKLCELRLAQEKNGATILQLPKLDSGRGLHAAN